MVSSRTGRLVGVLFLLVVLGGLCVGFGVENSVVDGSPVPNADDLAYDYTGHIGQAVHVGGPVVETDPVVIETEYEYYADGEQHAGILRLTIHDVSTPVEKGHVLRTYAVVQPNTELVARNELVIPQWHYWYMYVVSAIAGFWVLARLIRGWTIDIEELALIRRNTSDSPGGGS